jgi:hypothetical protein
MRTVGTSAAVFGWYIPALETERDNVNTLGMLQKYQDDVQRVQGVWACDPAKCAHLTALIQIAASILLPPLLFLMQAP